MMGTYDFFFKKDKDGRLLLEDAAMYNLLRNNGRLTTTIEYTLYYNTFLGISALTPRGISYRHHYPSDCSMLKWLKTELSAAPDIAYYSDIDGRYIPVQLKISTELLSKPQRVTDAVDTCTLSLPDSLMAEFHDFQHNRLPSAHKPFLDKLVKSLVAPGRFREQVGTYARLLHLTRSAATYGMEREGQKYQWYPGNAYEENYSDMGLKSLTIVQLVALAMCVANHAEAQGQKRVEISWREEPSRVKLELVDPLPAKEPQLSDW